MAGGIFRVSKIRIVGLACGLLIGGLFCLVSFISESIAVSKGIEDFNTLKSDEFKKGRFVQGTVLELDIDFAEEWEQRKGSTKKETTSRYYIMPLKVDSDEGNIKYIPVKFSKSIDLTKADRLVNEYGKYFETGDMPLSFSTFEMTGKVSKLDKKIEGYLYEALIYNEFGKTKEECKQYVCDYCIVCKEPATVTELLIGIVLTSLGVGILVIVAVRSRRYGS